VAKDQGSSSLDVSAAVDPGSDRFDGMEAAAHPTRLTQAANSRRYDRVARVYALLEPLYLIFPPARRRGVAALGLAPGDVVLEVGAGTGRNFPYLVEAVGPTGKVIGVDPAPGMLAEARRLVDREGWANVELVEGDAGRLRLDREVDAVLFSLSYSAIPDPRPALAQAWECLRPGGRVVVLDAGFTSSRAWRLLDPVARLLVKLGPGDAYSDPWPDLARYGEVWTRRFLLGYFYVCRVEKRSPSAP
jgi:ubiquinone/menaquinone biosynthesis C-methylase UbiE